MTSGSPNCRSPTRAAVMTRQCASPHRRRASRRAAPQPPASSTPRRDAARRTARARAAARRTRAGPRRRRSCVRRRATRWHAPRGPRRARSIAASKAARTGAREGVDRRVLDDDHGDVAGRLDTHELTHAAGLIRARAAVRCPAPRRCTSCTAHDGAPDASSWLSAPSRRGARRSRRAGARARSHRRSDSRARHRPRARARRITASDCAAKASLSSITSMSADAGSSRSEQLARGRRPARCP